MKLSDFTIQIILDDFFDKMEGLFSRSYEPLVFGVIKDTASNGDITSKRFYSYPEFPLFGDSWLDFTVGYIDGIALEYDLSTRGIDSPTKVHFIPGYEPGTEESILKPLDAMDFSEALALRMRGASERFPLNYCGYFRGRGKNTLRIVPYYRGDMDPESFFKTVENFGYTHFTREMKELLSPFITPFFSCVEVGLNLNLDGSLNKDIGFIFNVPNVNDKAGGRSISRFKESGYEDFLISLKNIGLIDDRYKIAMNAIYARDYIFNRLKDMNNLRVFNGFRGVKLSWKDGRMQPAKMYMDLYFWESV